MPRPRSSTSVLTAAVAGTALGLGAVALGAAPAAADLGVVEKVIGGATGIEVDVEVPALPAPVPVTVPPTPQVTLPPSGGQSQQSVVGPVGQPAAAQASALNAATQGSGVGTPNGKAQSAASVANLTAGGGAVDADVVGSECSANRKGNQGSSSIVGGTAGGQPIPVAAPPNTGGAIPGVGSVFVNRQESDEGPGGNHITVSALDIDLDLAGQVTGSVTVAESECGVRGVPAGSTGPSPGRTPDGPTEVGLGDPGSGDGGGDLLPRTGSDVAGLAAGGLALTGVGLGLRHLARRRLAT